jgi:hypothetical protein
VHVPNDADFDLGPIARRLRELHEDVRSCLSQSTREHSQELGLILQIESDIGIWERRTERYPSSVLLNNARRELGFAIYSVSSGLYLQAYSNLRLFLELSFASVYFSVHEIERRRWLDNRLNFSWSAALEKENGVLSPNFVREFLPRAVEEAPYFGSEAIRVYGNCSQFIHGKTVATERLPRTVAYRADVLLDWHENARLAATCVLYLLYCRYADELLPYDDGHLADTLEHSFSHLSSVRETIRDPSSHHGE